MSEAPVYEVTHEHETLAYELILSRRKTLGIVIYPDLRVVVKAPQSYRLKKIEKYIKKHFIWIQKKLKSFKNHEEKITRLTYSHGEQHYYLGQAYPLEIIGGDINRVELRDDVLVVMCKGDASSEEVKRHLDAWYFTRAKTLFTQLMQECWPRFNHPELEMPSLIIRKLRSRWGSLSLKTYRVMLNSELIKASQECIESVIMHEFCHIKHQNHGPGFYGLFEQVFPNWRACNKQLNRQLLRRSV